MPKENKNSGSGKDGPPRQGEKGGKGGTQNTGVRSGGSKTPIIAAVVPDRPSVSK